MISHSIDGSERFTVDDPVRISKDAMSRSIFHGAPDNPHPWAGKPGYYTGLRNSEVSSEVVVRLSNREQVFVDVKYLEPRKVRPKKEKEIPSNSDTDEGGMQIKIIG
jgi:hypothetical protein